MPGQIPVQTEFSMFKSMFCQRQDFRALRRFNFKQHFSTGSHPAWRNGKEPAIHIESIWTAIQRKAGFASEDSQAA